MRPLFFRILALLLGAFLLVVLAGFFLARWSNDELRHDHEQMQALAMVASGRLVDAHLAGSDHTLRRRLHRRYHAVAWVLDGQNRLLSGPPLPPRLLEKIRTLPSVVRLDNGRHGGTVFANEIHRNQMPYRVLMLVPPGRGFPGLPVTGRLLILLLSLAVASAVLSYWIIRPLRAMQKATATFGEASMESRMPSSITRRRDAFGELGREFNTMTDRVEQTLQSQQQLLRDVSHELRSPLARIQVASSLLAQKFGEHEELQRIESEVERLDDLIERLLTLSRLHSAELLRTEEVDLTGLIQSLIDDANFEFSADDVRAVLAVSPSVVIEADRDLVASALENIIRNALRFTRSGTEVRVTLRVQSDEVVEVAVADHGPGVSEKDRANLFQPFYRVDNARTLGDGHHGIGLAMARAVATLHGGDISATNRPAGGLVVTLRLPVDRNT